MPPLSKRASSSAQSADAETQNRKLPPYYPLPNLNNLLNEGKKTIRPALPQPAQKPSTTCGYRDEACKKLKEEEKKKVSRNASQEPADSKRKSDRGWLNRLGRVFSKAFSSADSAASTGNSYMASNLNRSAGHSVPVPAANASSAALQPSFTAYLQAKLDPRYRVGGGGEDLFSGNYNLSLPVLSLPGRAGLDLNLTVSYNSLVWIKWSNIASFDYDYYPTLTPGFRIGFPEIQGMYSLNGVNTYIVYLPSGNRIEMRQVSANRFEAIDSSYLYLVTNAADPTQMTLYSTDGTQYKFERPFGGNSDSRCTQIKDSNGNFISIVYKNVGSPSYPLTVIDKVIDTLGREIMFNYDGALHLISITQNWSGQTYYWAQFEYGTKTVTPNFGSLYVDGPNNAAIPVITRIITGDGARYTFDYNSWGQAQTITTFGEADNLRSQVAYAFPGTGSPLSDCPRFSQRNDIVFAWPGEVYNAQTQLGYATTYFYFEPSETFGQVTGPDAVTHREIFSTSGGTRGLTTRTETHYGGQIQQFSDITWASDSTTSPPLRPRVTETKLCDDRNHNGTYQSGTDKLRRTIIDYTTISGTAGMPSTIKLPWITREYNEGGGSVYRSTKTDYLSDANYLDRRIIGLPGFSYLYQGDQATLVAQSGYIYDSPNEAGTTFIQGHSSAARQHDGANYGTGFLYRGNLTKTRRYSVVGGSASSPTERKTGYYITGTPALTKDGVDHQTTIFYDDSFRHYTESSGTLGVTTVTPSPSTFAYPTRVQNPDNYSSTLSYNYDFGAVTRAVNPKAYAANPGNPQTMGIRTYDSKGRLDKSLMWKDGTKYSQSRYVYGTDHNFVQTWTTVNTLSEETATLSLLDGVGRERMAVNEHPGSVGGLSALYRVFDKNGRISEWSRPTEISSTTWAPAGDDSAYVITQQAFDWKGRPTVTTNPDTSNRIITYEGCGCAGADVTTIQGESTTGGTPANRRTQKVYRDVQGRTIKTQILNYDTSIYSTTLTEYDVRDLVMTSKTFKGDAAVGASCPLGTCQQTEMVYDGYARLQKQYLPIYQDPGVAPPYSTNASARSTTRQYYNDDMVYIETDPRGATATYSYNNRDLVSSVNYFSPGGVSAKPSTSFSYDELGGRLTMVNSNLSASYAYNTLGQMTSESRVFSTAGAPSGTFTANYDYGPIGQLKWVRDPYGDQINYTYDKAGRVISADGATPFAGQTNYLALGGIQYRAWGAPKNGRGYDSRMRLTSSGSTVYQYNAASDMIYAQQNFGEPYHQSLSYDHVGRLTGVSTPEITVPSQYVLTVSSPPNGLPPGLKIRPFTTNVAYDEFGNVTNSGGDYWHDRSTNLNSVPQVFQTTYVNNRAMKDNVPGRVINNVQQTWVYNAMGQVTADTRTVQTYDAAGQVTRTQDANNAQIYVNYNFDGDGRQTKFDQKRDDGTIEIRYRFYSSVLGDLLTDISSTGQKIETRVYDLVYPQGIIRQVKAYSVPNGGNPPNNFPDTVVFEGTDPHRTRATVWDRNSNTYKYVSLAAPGAYVEDIDWAGMKSRYVSNIGSQISYGQVSASQYIGSYFSNVDPRNPGTGCSLDNVKVQCSDVFKAIRQGSLGRLDVSSPLNGVFFPGGAIFRTTDPDADDLHQGVLAYTGDLGILEGPQQPGKEPAKPLCDVPIPTDRNERDVIATILAESEVVGEGKYGDDQGGKGGQQRYRDYGNPSAGVITAADVTWGMILMIRVIDYRFHVDNYSSWSAVVTARQRPKKGQKIGDPQFIGYPHGIAWLNDPNKLAENNGKLCEQLRLAVNSLYLYQNIKENINLPNFYEWRGIKQDYDKGKGIRPRQGAYRVANSDFF